ncbi:toxin-antitoxin system, toxin component [Streptomyces sp. NPDC058734]|uniref:toxin-antitoxin system, toxin component n=1 Tax=Streptomyces sp. NPDC058734 TaxID=3346615 RepID=UPI0036C2C774
MNEDRQINRLSKQLAKNLPRPTPDNPRELLQAICTQLAEERGRTIRLMFRAFPPETVSGLWLKLPDEDLIVIEEGTTWFHQLVILGHEIWHMVSGRGSACVGHSSSGEQVVAAARSLGEDFDLAEALELFDVAARTEVDVNDEESTAERAGLAIATAVRRAMQTSQAPSFGLAGRIQQSLGG